MLYEIGSRRRFSESSASKAATTAAQAIRNVNISRSTICISITTDTATAKAETRTIQAADAKATKSA